VIPKITDKPNEPDFFAPSEEWRGFVRTLSLRERIEFYTSLEMIIQRIQGAEIERLVSDLGEEYKISGPRFDLSDMLYWN
jgi:hypothetical protein